MVYGRNTSESGSQANTRQSSAWWRCCGCLLHLPLQQMESFHSSGRIKAVTPRSVVIWSSGNSPRHLKNFKITKRARRKFKKKKKTTQNYCVWCTVKGVMQPQGQQHLQDKGLLNSWDIRQTSPDTRCDPANHLNGISQVTNRQRKDEGDAEKKGEFLE